MNMSFSELVFGNVTKDPQNRRFPDAFRNDMLLRKREIVLRKRVVVLKLLLVYTPRTFHQLKH